MNLQIADNGRPPENTPRAEGKQEKQGQDNLQLQTRKADGSLAREKKQYIITFENVSQFNKPFVIKEVNTVHDLLQEICKMYPRYCHESVGFRVSDTRMGAMNRIFYTEELPLEKDSLYISLYLRKHPPLPMGKFEWQTPSSISTFPQQPSENAYQKQES